MDQNSRANTVAELTELIKKGNAHVSFSDAVADLSEKFRTVIPDGLPYSIWQLVEHMRIAQKDIVDFSASENFESLEWPKEYWTENQQLVNDETWQNSISQILDDQNRFLELLKDERNDLFTPFEWGDGQNLFREAVLIADHNSYHTAEIVIIRRLLKCWK